MKNKISRLFIMIVIMLAPAAVVLADSLTNGLVGFWRFEDGAGAVAKDSSPAGNQGVIHGDAAWTNGAVGQALVFNGSNTYVEIPPAASLGMTNALSVAVWVKFRQADGKKRCQPILDKTRGTGKNHGWALLWDDRVVEGVFFAQALRWELYVRQAGCVIWDSITDDFWHHIAGTFDIQTKPFQLKLYLDGCLIGFAEISVPPSANELPIFIGASDLTERFKGLLDEVRIYKRALSEDEVLDLFISRSKGGGKNTK